MKIVELIADYLKYLFALGRSYYTINDAKFVLRSFNRFLEEEEVYNVTDLTRYVLEEYRQELAFSLTAKGNPLAIRTQLKRLGTVKGFTRYLKEFDYFVSDPGENLKLPKEPRDLPRVIMDSDDVQKMLLAPDIHTNRGYRNRVILELLYDTAIRRLEVATLKVPNLDLKTGYIHVHGKGDKDRVVPVGKRVSGIINNYIMLVRPSFIQGDDPGYLILNRWGNQMNPNSIWAVVKRCAHLAGIKKNVSTHTFRHTCATHMLRNGAPIRHLQEMLGHESLESTQIYTRVTINDLKLVHAKYHPGESMK